MLQFIIMFARYAAGIFVAFMVSMIVFFLSIGILHNVGGEGIMGPILQCVLFMILMTGGFSGVFAGSMCFDQVSRRFGSIFLLILGQCFYSYILFCIKDPPGLLDDPSEWFGLIALTLGGLGAVILIFRRLPRKS